MEIYLDFNWHAVNISNEMIIVIRWNERNVLRVVFTIKKKNKEKFVWFCLDCIRVYIKHSSIPFIPLQYGCQQYFFVGIVWSLERCSQIVILKSNKCPDETCNGRSPIAKTSIHMEWHIKHEFARHLESI